MKRNFIDDGENTALKTKGVAIRISTDLFKKMKQQETPQNELISEALDQYFKKDHIIDKSDEEIPIEIYEEIFSTLHNNEIAPLNRNIAHKKDIIKTLESQIKELKQDKKFFMNLCNELMVTFQKQKKQSFRERRKLRKQNKDTCDDKKIDQN